jgi:hypothetical protein
MAHGVLRDAVIEAVEQNQDDVVFHGVPQSRAPEIVTQKKRKAGMPLSS